MAGERSKRDSRFYRDNDRIYIYYIHRWSSKFLNFELCHHFEILEIRCAITSSGIVKLKL